MYKPKRKKYPALATLMKEMLDHKVRSVKYDGYSIKTKTHEYTMVDSEIYIEEIKNETRENLG